MRTITLAFLILTIGTSCGCAANRSTGEYGSIHSSPSYSGRQVATQESKRNTAKSSGSASRSRADRQEESLDAVQQLAETVRQLGENIDKPRKVVLGPEKHVDSSRSETYRVNANALLAPCSEIMLTFEAWENFSVGTRVVYVEQTPDEERAHVITLSAKSPTSIVLSSYAEDEGPDPDEEESEIEPLSEEEFGETKLPPGGNTSRDTMKVGSAVFDCVVVDVDDEDEAGKYWISDSMPGHIVKVEFRDEEEGQTTTFYVREVKSGK